MRTSSFLFLVAALAFSFACQPELGDCDQTAATVVYYVPDAEGNRVPAYGGQALMEVSCANDRCHAAGTGDPQGVPAGFELDVRVALSPDELDRLRDSHARVVGNASDLWAEIESGRMPPGEPVRSVIIGSALAYETEAGEPLPIVASPEATEMLRNWLACGAPVVEATEGTATGIGDIVPIIPFEEPPLECPDGQAECIEGSCQDVLADPANCGACDNDCGGLFCADGTCTATCPAGTTECAGGCVDSQTSALHCGACGNACDALEVCDAGACVCAGATMDCGGGCTDVSTDPMNCGGCGVACGAGEGCAAGSCVSCGPDATLSGDVQPIFTRSCATTGCHTGTRASAGLDLRAGTAYGDLVGVGSSAAMCGGRVRVVPGDPDASYLLDKLTGAPGICGVQMPRRGESIAASEIDLIRGWICRGAVDD